MTDKQNEKLNMYQTVLKFCTEHSKSYADMPAFGRCVEDLVKSINHIKIAAENQSSIAIKGATVQKGTALDHLVKACTSVVGILCACAYDKNNSELLGRSQENKKMLGKSHGNRLLSVARNIASDAAMFDEELADYGFNEDVVGRLSTIIDEYENLIVLPRTAINERKRHTENLAKQLVATDAMLINRMDRLVLRYSIDNPDFYNGYKSARSINNSYVRRRSGKPADSSDPAGSEQ